MTPIIRTSCRRPTRSLVALSVAIVLCSCTGQAATESAARAQIEAVTRRWEASLMAGDPASTIPEVFTEDALRMPAHEDAVRGRVAIAEALAGSVALTSARFDLEEIEVEGDLAYAVGRYAVRAPDGQELNGKFLEVWKRTAEGWRIHRVMWD